jgi:hypothetical protein
MRWTEKLYRILFRKTNLSTWSPSCLILHFSSPISAKTFNLVCFTFGKQFCAIREMLSVKVPLPGLKVRTARVINAKRVQAKRNTSGFCGARTTLTDPGVNVKWWGGPIVGTWL